MMKWILSLLSITLISSVYAADYPTCIHSRAVPNLADIKQKIVLCPKGFITANVLPRTKYRSFAIPYNNYCRDIKLIFSTNSANVLINDWQYSSAKIILQGHKPKGNMQIPHISTGMNKGVIKITNESDTSVCIGEQCLYG